MISDNETGEVGHKQTHPMTGDKDDAMENIASHITSSLPTRGYEEKPEGAEPLHFGSEPRRRTVAEHIALALIRFYADEVRRYGLTALEPATVEEIDAAGRVSWELELELMSDETPRPRPPLFTSFY